MLVNTTGLAVEFEPQHRSHFLSTDSIRSMARWYLDGEKKGDGAARGSDETYVSRSTDLTS